MEVDRFVVGFVLFFLGVLGGGGGGGFSLNFLAKSFWRYCLTKNHSPVPELLDGFRDLYAHPGPRGGRAQIWARKFEFSEIDQNQACGYSTCRSQCPEHEDNFLFEIGLKLTELRGVTR